MDIFFQPMTNSPSQNLHIIHNIPPHAQALLCYNLTIKRKDTTDMKTYTLPIPPMQGAQYNNRGGWYEIALKRALGYKCDKVAPRGAYDIEEIKGEIKSADATLYHKTLGADLFTSITKYFDIVDIDIWYYVGKFNNELYAFKMNAREFYAFLYEFARYDITRGTVRLATLSRRMRKWTERPICASNIIVLE